MQLTDNKHIKSYVAKALVEDGWTMEKLATASLEALQKYKRIGKTTAQNIINEAQFLVNHAKLKEAVAIQRGEPPASVEPQMSVRARRIKEQNRQ